ncbi:peptidoglycan D,D-transpeptidase FtsI family protein [Eubacterium oxidoreducens]|uniref:peptidoglycan D,D-transpeptidase FtsI family protein n=1 Tax=Eubacterium oxidoreducens TaxID=1732 RepID=UPI000B7D8160|nr:penicillin-binding transpeptidase domain-containing protein [Eubacterium oxidoreducens]
MAIFIILIVYFAYFMIMKSDEYVNSSYNPRLDTFSETVVRGSILTESGDVLAQTEVDSEGNETRVYPYDNLFAHVVGYSTNGMAGLELAENTYMLRSHSSLVEKVVNDVKEEKSQGDNIITTLDTSIQEAAYEALGDYDGAVVAIEPETGKVIAMVSKPDYDPNTIAQDWESLTSEDNDSSQLLNRATQGQYPPGSTFKIITALEYLIENDNNYEDYSYTCTGSTTMGNKQLKCYQGEVHGSVDLAESFAESCNTSFANMALDFDKSDYISLCDKMLFNQKIDFTLSTVASSFSYEKSDGDAMLMQTAIGQGETLVTPLHMALIAASIANDGVALKPYLVDSIESYDGNVVEEYEAEEYATLMTQEQSEILETFMRKTVKTGTASALLDNEYKAYGKTGTAEFNSSGDSHAWFVGYATKEGKKSIAIAVIVEDSGAGSKYAVPVADELFDAYFASDISDEED